MISEQEINIKRGLFISAEEPRSLSVRSGELLLSDKSGTTQTRFPFQKIAAIFIAGSCTLSSPMLEKLSGNAVPLCLMKASLRPVLWMAHMAEANYLLRKKQYALSNEDISVARVLIANKIENQGSLLRRLPCKDESSLERIDALKDGALSSADYTTLMKTEAHAAKLFFRTWFASLRWSSRKPRLKSDPVNAALDIGYTVLFNYIEANLRLFGFDLYVGVFHREWFRRKSLVCDMMEPFRCIIDRETLADFRGKVFRNSDFEYKDGQYLLKNEYRTKYYRNYVEAITIYKMEIFKYIRDYYRCFMKGSSPDAYPRFKI